MRTGKRLVALCLTLSCFLMTPLSIDAHDDQGQAQPPANQTAATARTTPAWVARSNENAQVLLRIFARFNPEGAGQLGIEGLDEQIADLQPGIIERARQATREGQRTLEGRLASERDPAVRQDLEILIKAARDNVRGSELAERYNIPYFNMSQTVFQGLRSLLDDQVPAARRPAALVRLRRYAGMEQGYTPITTLAEQRTRERLSRPGLLGPVKAEVERDLATANFFVNGIKQLFDRYQIAGYEEAYNRLKEQLTAYEGFIRREILPRARTDFRLPAELYAFSLEQVGVDIPVEQLVRMARASFTEIQREMQELAPRVARERGWNMTDYRDVIRALKREQLVGDAIMPHYENRQREIEEIIRRERLVTLPARPMRIRLASEAESAQVPAPHMRPPRLLNNTGQMGEFVLPLRIPAPPGATANATQQFDDFTYTAASWTLTAHEGRPGHEMQFASMIEKGVSTARAIFAFNSTNAEGWGLYSEAIIKPYMPLDGQLISLQFRLFRAARAFLDPELHMGRITPEEALRILREDAVLSEAMANQEVQRYTFLSPGQATSYFYGYTRLMDLRAETERVMGRRFNQQQFHDFILSQGMLPPNLLRQAVMTEFAGANRSQPAPRRRS